MTEKLLFELCAIQTEDGYQYRMRRGNRVYVLRSPEGKGIRKRPHARGRNMHARPGMRRRARHALGALESLYSELYDTTEAPTRDSQSSSPVQGTDLT